jgi:hypothetical protein
MRDVEDKIGQANRCINSLFEQARYADALQLAEQSSVFARQHLDETHPLYADSLNNLGYLLPLCRQTDRAQVVCVQLLSAR